MVSKMSNKSRIYLSPLDELVAELPPELRRQIILDFDELERTGKNGDTVLREQAGLIYRKLQGRPSGFDAAYMMFVGLSAHKVASVESMDAAEDLDLHDRKILSKALVDEIAAMSPEDLAASLGEIQDRARQIAGRQEDPSFDGP